MRHFRQRLIVVSTFLLMVCCLGCQQRLPEPVRLSGKAQGTYYTIAYYDTLQRDLRPQIDSLFRAFDLTASLWEDSSLLCRVNRNETDTINSLFADLLQKSLYMNRFTQGAFDCTIGKLVNAWGFGANKRTELTERQIDSLIQYTGPGQLSLTYNSDLQRWILSKQHAETTIDFNAIAQGVTSDLIGNFLLRHGITNFLVDVGGEVLAKGCKADSSAWAVGIERPAANKYSPPEVQLTIGLKDLSVVTSGSYRKYYEKNGIRYSHTIDPSTGHPVQHSLLSVSVVDKTAWRADALATSFMVMGLEKGLAFINQHPYDFGAQHVYFIYNENGENKTYATPAFRQLIME